MKVIIKTSTELNHVNAAIDVLFPQLHSIDDLGEPLIAYPTKTIWVRDYEGTLPDGMMVKVSLYIRKIRGGISITGTETTPIKAQEEQ